MKDAFLPSSNGIDEVYTRLWMPTGTVRGIVQVAHGMCEHIERYAPLADFLGEQGYAVVGNDHLGHGKTASHTDELGVMRAHHLSANLVEDMRLVTLWAQHFLGDAPVFLCGHSMGSFLARRYAMTYGKHLAGLILLGTGSQPSSSLALAELAGVAVEATRGSDFHTDILTKAATTVFNRQFSPARTDFDWTSSSIPDVDALCDDPLCLFTFSVHAYRVIFDALTFIQDPAHVALLPSSLPILLMSGSDDPVGHFGEDAIHIAEEYEQQCTDVTYIIYEGLRHQLLVESKSAEVMADLVGWLNAHTLQA